MSADQPTRRRGPGAPTKYRPQFCERLLQASRDGLSLTAFAGEIDTTRDVLWDWAHRHPAFANAVQRAKAIRLASWERRAIGIADGRLPYAGTAMTIFALKNCDPDEWREKTVVEHDVSDRVADRLEAARLRMLGELKLIDAVPSEAMADTASAEHPANPPSSERSKQVSHKTSHDSAVG